VLLAVALVQLVAFVVVVCSPLDRVLHFQFFLLCVSSVSFFPIIFFFFSDLGLFVALLVSLDSLCLLRQRPLDGKITVHGYHVL
jgi:hypothetical protein